MVSALAAQNIAGIKVLLPIYTQWPQHDAGLAKFARATVAQAEGRSGGAVKLYRELIAAEPDSRRCACGWRRPCLKTNKASGGRSV